MSAVKLILRFHRERSTPVLDFMVRSQRRSRLPIAIGIAPIPFRYAKLLRYSYVVQAWYEEKLTLPVYPILVRTFNILTKAEFKKDSLCRFQPKPADQNCPYLLFDPNFEDPET